MYSTGGPNSHNMNAHNMGGNSAPVPVGLPQPQNQAQVQQQSNGPVPVNQQAQQHLSHNVNNPNNNVNNSGFHHQPNSGHNISTNSAVTLNSAPPPHNANPNNNNNNPANNPPNNATGVNSNNPLPMPSTARFNEILEALKQEHETSLREMGMFRMQKDDFERKIQTHINEISQIQGVIFELERAHVKAKQQYEEEIVRLRRELESLRSSSSSDQDSMAKRQRTMDLSPGTMNRPSSTTPITRPPPAAGRVRFDLDPNLPPQFKKGASDWSVMFNPFTPKSLDLDLVFTLEHASVVCCIKFSEDGKYVATGSNKTAQVYDVTTGNKLCVLSENADSEKDLYIRSVCFSPDGKYLAAGAEDKIIRLWDIEQKTIFRKFSGHEQDIYSLDYSRDGKLLVSGSGDRNARIWEVESGKCLHSLRADDSSAGSPANKDCGITSVCFSPDGKLVAAGSLDRNIRLWDVTSGAFLEKLEGHLDSVYSVAFSPNGTHLVSGSLDRTLKVWKLGRPSVCERTLTGHEDFVLSLSFLTDSEFIVSGSKDRSALFWDLRSILSASPSTTNNSATGSTNPSSPGLNTTNANSSSNPISLVLHGHKNSVISVASSPRGRFIATGSGDCKARIWAYRSVESGSAPSSSPLRQSVTASNLSITNNNNNNNNNNMGAPKSSPVVISTSSPGASRAAAPGPISSSAAPML